MTLSRIPRLSGYLRDVPPRLSFLYDSAGELRMRDCAPCSRAAVFDPPRHKTSGFALSPLVIILPTPGPLVSRGFPFVALPCSPGRCYHWIVILWLLHIAATKNWRWLAAAGLQFFSSIFVPEFLAHHPCRCELFLDRDYRGKGGRNARPLADDGHESAVASARQVDCTPRHRSAPAFGAVPIYLAGNHARWSNIAIKYGRPTALVAYLLFVGNLGLVCSVICRRSTRASFLTSLLLGLFLLGPEIGNVILAKITWSSYPLIKPQGLVIDLALAIIEWGRALSAYRRIGIILMTGFSEPMWGVQV